MQIICLQTYLNIQIRLPNIQTELKTETRGVITVTTMDNCVFVKARRMMFCEIGINFDFFSLLSFFSFTFVDRVRLRMLCCSDAYIVQIDCFRVILWLTCFFYNRN